ncbi:hypothetical protein CYMTET_4642 [Cymbomonas tetramitiformis]|uniref:Uncharacterized protein n=1 Tax=Cymbomonas tetramitiformis TaxID=36881 RepID=A0AAE0H0Z8_9CHLO|nr:hypothetical protein CYMTET_4642 [Cymbomonas tetramitiformis]
MQDKGAGAETSAGHIATGTKGGIKEEMAGVTEGAGEIRGAAEERRERRSGEDSAMHEGDDTGILQADDGEDYAEFSENSEAEAGVIGGEKVKVGEETDDVEETDHNTKLDGKEKGRAKGGNEGGGVLASARPAAGGAESTAGDGPDTTAELGQGGTDDEAVTGTAGDERVPDHREAKEARAGVGSGALGKADVGTGANLAKKKLPNPGASRSGGSVENESAVAGREENLKRMQGASSEGHRKGHDSGLLAGARFGAKVHLAP